MEVRPERETDRARIRGILLAAFPTALEADLVEALRADPAYRPELALLAVEDDVVVGYVILTEMTLAGERRRDVLALGPIAVPPERQSAGVGSRLMTEAIARATDAGAALIVLVGEPEYYGRFGFRPAGELGVTCPPYPEEYLLARSLPSGADPPRGAVAYAAPFDAAEG